MLQKGGSNGTAVPRLAVAAYPWIDGWLSARGGMFLFFSGEYQSRRWLFVVLRKQDEKSRAYVNSGPFFFYYVQEWRSGGKRPDIGYAERIEISRALDIW